MRGFVQSELMQQTTYCRKRRVQQQGCRSGTFPISRAATALEPPLLLRLGAGMGLSL